MPELVTDFQSLPDEYQRLIRLAQDRYNITVAPLQLLVGGWSGAVVYLVSVSANDTRRVEHCILKLDRKGKSSKSDEVTRHNLATSKSPSDFARDHIAELVFDRVEQEGTIAIFYRIAGQSLLNYRPLSRYERQSQLKTIFEATNKVLLAEWNVNATFEQAVHPRQVLEKWLGFRLEPGGNIERFLQSVCRVNPDIPSFLISGNVFPNPLAYARQPEYWGKARPIDIALGLLHGDLNTNNILVKFADNQEALEGYYLIDFALFKEHMPLLYDQRYLEMSYLIHAMSQVTLAKCINLLTLSAEVDILEPQAAPIEMSGVSTVVAAARRAFAAWVNETHPSLQDDLWGQYWLAGVAAGLSYCHKAGQADEERLAGLIYAAVNLKHCAAVFGLPLPTDAQLLYAEGQFGANPHQPGHPAGDAPGLPSGTVTFLYTDIEGSTPLWEKVPDAMRGAVAQHNVLLRQAIEANNGKVFLIIGDAFQAAFRLASDALCAALAAQRALRDAHWGPTGPLKVRMGLHTGTAELDGGPDGAYQSGHTLNRAARTMSAGHGGQVLLSQEAADLVESNLPAGVTLLDLGQHQLKGMQRLEHLYQLVAPDLPDHFPPLATGVAHPHNLPAQLTSFIGREKEIAALHALFLTRGACLVTLTGSGGTGKTRLAVRAAERLLESFAQGVWLVELAPVSDPQLVPRAVAKALGVPEDPQQSMDQALASYLHGRQVLLILDNCEHVVGAAAALAGQLLQACPQVHLLATSREILGVEGETPFRCPSLSLPAGKPLAGELAQAESVRLFVERVQTVSPGFVLTESNAPLVARICQRLDGIPLAIELAAARTRMLSLDQIAARLDQVFRLLTGGGRSALPRHQTLKALIDWSYDLLSAEERALLLRLSVFAGGWTLDAAEQVCADRAAGPGQGENLLLGEHILDLLGQLLDKSLIQIEQEQAGEPRYRMLETVRQYAHERLSEIGGVEDLRERHLDYCLDLALRAQPNFRAKEARRWLDAVDRELDNLRLALEWALSGSVVKGLRLAAALHWLWQLRDHRAEGTEWLDKLLAAEELRSAERPRVQADWVARGRALYTWVILAVMHSFGDPAQARERGLESKAIFQKLCDEPGDTPSDSLPRDLALAHYSMATTWQDFMACRQMFQAVHAPFWIAECDLWLTGVCLQVNDFDKADFFAKEHLALRKEMGDLDGEGYALFLAATIALFRGKPDQAIELANRSLSCYEMVGNREAVEYPRSILRVAAMSRGDYPQVRELNEMNRALGQDLRSPVPLVAANSYDALVAWSLNEYERAALYAHKALEAASALSFNWQKLALYVLGRVALSHGDFTQAGPYLLKALTKARLTLWFNDYQAILALGGLAVAQQQPRRAAVLFGAQEGLAGWIMNLIGPAERDEYHQAVRAARAALGEDGFAAAWAEGRSMTEAQVRQYAEALPMETPEAKYAP